MNPQQLLDYIIKPTLQYMGGNYYSKESAFLLLCTAAIESNCGEYIKQINGPAIGIFQMEPDTNEDIWEHCDALQNNCFGDVVHGLWSVSNPMPSLIQSPMYACAMARLKYSMDPHPLPKLTGVGQIDSRNFYDYYKRVYNTELGASTFAKWSAALYANKISEVEL